MNELDELIPTAVRRLQLVVGALITGVLLFSAVAVLVVANEKIVQTRSTDRMFLYILPALAIACVVAFSVFRRAQDSRLAHKASSVSDNALLGAYSNRTIVGTALGESVALVAVVGYLVTGNQWLIVGVVAAVFAMTTLLPTEGKLREFLRGAGRLV